MSHLFPTVPLATCKMIAQIGSSLAITQGKAPMASYLKTESRANSA